MQIIVWLQGVQGLRSILNHLTTIAIVLCYTFYRIIILKFSFMTYEFIIYIKIFHRISPTPEPEGSVGTGITERVFYTSLASACSIEGQSWIKKK